MPRTAVPAPAPDFTLLRGVRDFLDQRRPADVDLVLLSPEYVRLHVAAVVAPEGAFSAASLGLRCREAIDRYLHPIFGGEEGRGWNFGERPEQSDIYRVLESLDGVEYVRSLELHLESKRPELLDTRRFLICSGEHRIQLTT